MPLSNSKRWHWSKHGPSYTSHSPYIWILVSGRALLAIICYLSSHSRWQTFKHTGSLRLRLGRDVCFEMYTSGLLKTLSLRRKDGSNTKPNSPSSSPSLQSPSHIAGCIREEVDWTGSVLLTSETNSIDSCSVSVAYFYSSSPKCCFSANRN